jgi:hypothetical protein
MAVEVVNEETKLILHKCVESLQQQVASVREVTKRGEDEIEQISRQWEDYLSKIGGEETRVRDLALRLLQLQTAEEQSIEDKLLQLEDVETGIEERLQGIAELLQRGQELIKVAPFYRVPENAYALLDAIKSLEEVVRDERNKLLHKAAVTAEYRQTLEEFAEIVLLLQTLAESKLVAPTPSEAAQELDNRQRFLFSLSHFRQVLDGLEIHLDLATRSQCQQLHQDLVAQADAILQRAVQRQEGVEMGLVSWGHLEQQWLAEDDWFRELLLKLPDTTNVSAHKFPELIEAFKVIHSFKK